MEDTSESGRDACILLQRLARKLGTEVEDMRTKKRYLADNFPGILPHLSGVADRLRSTAEAHATLSAVLGPQAPEQTYPQHPPQQQEQGCIGCREQ